MNKIDLDSTLCCGCAACANVCAHKAIVMVEDERGFIVPSIDESKCIDCGLCKDVCDFKKEKQTVSNILHAYSLVHNDEKILKNSTSGGAFTALSDIILNDGGLIVGAVMESDFTIHHVITNDYSIRDKMRGSKYVQSAMDNIYVAIKDILRLGKKVLFTGTPCQCAAVKSFFSDKYDNLYIVDFLCHGVPNNKMFKEHIHFLENQYNQKIVDFTFRDKRYGWNSYNNNNKFVNNKIGTKWINQAYYNFFISNLSLHDGCFHCKYRSLHRPSDITIADFWGIEKFTHKKEYNGVSLLLTHSIKGEVLLERSRIYSTVCEYPFEMVAYRVSLTPAPQPKKSLEFWNTYRVEGYQGLVNNFFDNSLRKRIRYEIRKVAKLLKL